MTQTPLSEQATALSHVHICHLCLLTTDSPLVTWIELKCASTILFHLFVFRLHRFHCGADPCSLWRCHLFSCWGEGGGRSPGSYFPFLQTSKGLFKTLFPYRKWLGGLQDFLQKGKRPTTWVLLRHGISYISKNESSRRRNPGRTTCRPTSSCGRKRFHKIFSFF